MIKNNKYVLIPDIKSEESFKTLFLMAASAGVGRVVDDNGVPLGPWTPNLLAQAISELPENTQGIELRTVQLWFQSNDRGINSANVRWIARVFGCDDQDVTVAWQVALNTALSRQRASRRQQRLEDKANLIAHHDSVRAAGSEETKRHKMRSSLARTSERLLSASPSNLASLVFAGAVALALASYFLNIHTVFLEVQGSGSKQVGFMWAPNWTILFLVFMPLFFIFLAETLTFWKATRQSLIANRDGWLRLVEAFSITFWVVFLICLFFAGILQWVLERLLPLLKGYGSFAPDWGFYAIHHPEVISVPASIAITGLAFLYMSLCFYLFMAGLILLYSLIQDFRTTLAKDNDEHGRTDQQTVDEIAIHIMASLYRCVSLSVMIAICMKLQSAYLSSDGVNILAWLTEDLSSVFQEGSALDNTKAHKQLNHFSSLILVLASMFVFFYGAVHIGYRRQNHAPLLMMITAYVVLVVSYTLIGTFDGFSMLLGLAVMVAVVGMVFPSFGFLHAPNRKSQNDVL